MHKDILCTITGTIGSMVAGMFGGFDAAVKTLVIFMAIDYISGLIVAGVFKTSNKTKSGALQSTAGWKGLCKKGMILFFVLIAHRLDSILGTTYIRDAVVIGYMTNELISITENAGLMGVPIPGTVKKAIDVLKERGKQNSENMH
jgi:toxin secretion/phage lysis holin